MRERLFGSPDSAPHAVDWGVWPGLRMTSIEDDAFWARALLAAIAAGNVVGPCPLPVFGKVYVVRSARCDGTVWLEFVELPGVYFAAARFRRVIDIAAEDSAEMVKLRGLLAAVSANGPRAPALVDGPSSAPHPAIRATFSRDTGEGTR